MPIRLRCLLEDLIDPPKQGVSEGFDRIANSSVQLASVDYRAAPTYVGFPIDGLKPGL